MIKKDSVKRIYIFFAIIVFIFLLLLGYLVFFRNGINQPDSVSSDQTQEWKTYINDGYGFSIKYPPDWTTNLEDIRNNAQPPELYYHQISFYPPSEVAKDYDKRAINVSVRLNSFSEEPPESAEDVKEIEISGKKGYTYKSEQMPGFYIYFTVLPWKYPKETFEINAGADADLLDVYLKMINTIEFF